MSILTKVTIFLYRPGCAQQTITRIIRVLNWSFIILDTSNMIIAMKVLMCGGCGVFLSSFYLRSENLHIIQYTGIYTYTSVYLVYATAATYSPQKNKSKPFFFIFDSRSPSSDFIKLRRPIIVSFRCFVIFFA